MNTNTTTSKPRSLRRLVSRVREYLLDQESNANRLTGKVITVMEYDPKTGAVTQQIPKFRARFFFAWYDAWVGVFWDQKKKQIYICPLPCLVVQIGYG